MTPEELIRIPFRFVAHLSMEDEHCLTYESEDGRLGWCDHTKKKKNGEFSIVRYYGHIQISGHEYVIVNKEGKDIFECSIEAELSGRAKAIEPGEPCDLCRRDFVTYYRRLGREKFIGVLEKHPRATDKELKKIFKEL